MATTQQLLDLKYDYQQALNEKQLKEMFSEILLGVFRGQNLKTFAEIKTATSLDIEGQNGGSYDTAAIKGIQFLTALETLSYRSMRTTDIGDLSGLHSLKQCSVNTNSLSTIGLVNKLTDLTLLSIYANQITTIGSIAELINLVTFYASGNKLVTVGSVSNLVNLANFTVDGNYFTAGNLTTLISEFRDMLYSLASPSRKLKLLDISGATMPIPTAGDIAKINEMHNTLGVTTITYRTA